jgi:glycosyltransferase 2 family protein
LIGRKIPEWVLPAVGYAVSAASLFWVFKRFDFVSLWSDVRALEWIWIVVGVACEMTSHVVDAWRWKVILQPAEDAPFWVCVEATFVGLFANDVLPAKAGEIIRAYLLAVSSEVPIALALMSAAIERLFDGLVMFLVFFAITLDMRNVGGLRSGMGLLGFITMGVLAIMLFILFYKSHAHTVISGNKFAVKFIHLLDELHRIGDLRALGTAFAISFLYLLLQICAVAALARADSFDFGLKEAAFVLLVLRLGTMIPNAPGNLGTFQFAAERALRLLTVEAASAKSFAAILYVFMTLPALVAGAISVAFTGVSIREIHHHARKAHSRPRPAQS